MTEASEFLVPRVGSLPVSSSRHYQTAAVTRQVSPPVTTVELHGALSLPDPAEVLRGLPAEGVLLTHEQSWAIAGVALGPLLHSVSLAPGEVTQIAVHSQSEKVAQRSVDAGLQVEDLSQSSASASALTETERASAAESAFGTSSASSRSSSTQAAAGGFASLLGISAGGSTQSASSNQAAFSTGARSVSDEANQSVHQAARDQAQLARSQHAVAVREVSESDRVEMTTRVVANYNHMHSLNMQYYEVEQVYQLRTRVTDAERLIFIPMKPIDFSDPTQADAAIRRYRSELMAAAADLGLHHVVAKIGAARLDHPMNQTEPAGVSPAEFLQTRVGELEGEAGEAQAAVNTAIADLNARQDDMYTAKDTLRAVNDAEHRRTAAASSEGQDPADDDDVGLAARATRQRALQAATVAVDAADANLTAARRALASVQQLLDTVRVQQAMVEAAASMSDEEMRAAMHRHREALNQGLWLRLDPSTMSGLFARRTFEGDHLGDMVDPTPVAVVGDLVGFRWRFRDPDEDAAYVERHLSAGTLEHSVTAPTGGIFAEAVLGTSVAAEKIDLTRFWNWKDALPPIHPTQIAPLSPSTEAAPDAPEIQQIQGSGINLGAVSFPDVASNIPALAQVLGNPELFRDMSGQETTAALAKSALELTASSADEAGRLANENFKRFMEFQRTIASSVADAAAGASPKKDLEPTLAGGVLNAKDEEAAGGATEESSTTESAGGEKLDVRFETDDDEDPEDPDDEESDDAVDPDEENTDV